ncbi:MAG: 2,3,4,5-tetrahydropyridine-2,6-dicarboxylate N-succinyltransferase, partial [Bacteroidales bacterium]|nr:2,3,4,5-tetrahydropyridine-2,6-dicarboxylate N-succinyltransferase [Bacteroidales bacterium]
MMEFQEVIKALEKGEVRVAEKTAGGWKVNSWVKEAILEGFRIGKLVDMSKDEYSFFDKDTLPLKKFSLEDRVRIVPGGSSVRCGAYLAPSVIMMPPSYVNIGAYVDEGTMIDSHALVGSCAQVGKRVHISASSQIGGVLEPAGALPVI